MLVRCTFFVLFDERHAANIVYGLVLFDELLVMLYCLLRDMLKCCISYVLFVVGHVGMLYFLCIVCEGHVGMLYF